MPIVVKTCWYQIGPYIEYEFAFLLPLLGVNSYCPLLVAYSLVAFRPAGIVQGEVASSIAAYQAALKTHAQPGSSPNQ